MTAKLLASGMAAVAAIGAAATGMTPVAMASTGPAGIQVPIALGPYAQAGDDDRTDSTTPFNGNSVSESSADKDASTRDIAPGGISQNSENISLAEGSSTGSDLEKNSLAGTVDTADTSMSMHNANASMPNMVFAQPPEDGDNVSTTSTDLDFAPSPQDQQDDENNAYAWVPYSPEPSDSGEN
jgi:hypothetical protein